MRGNLSFLPDRAAVKDSTSSIKTTTNDFRSSRYSFIRVNIFITSLPDSEKYFEKSEWALISSNIALLYFAGTVRMANLCANALNINWKFESQVSVGQEV